MSEFPIRRIDRLDFAYAPRPWEFAEARRPEILAHFRRQRSKKPALFNGPVLLMHQWTYAAGVLAGGFLRTDYASFMAWRDWGYPDATITNCFAQGALRGSDGGFLLGVMGRHTANAGRVYFPGGTPDPLDIADDCVDLDLSVRREMQEETGLAVDDLAIEPAWTAVFAGPRIALIKILQASEPAEALRRRVRRHLVTERTPELADIEIVGGPADLDARMPDFVISFLRNLWDDPNRTAPLAPRPRTLP